VNSFYQNVSLYWLKGKQTMIIARIHFKPEFAHRFIDSKDGSQSIIEQIFSSPEELIETIKEFEPYIVDCTTVINGRMLSLSCFKSA
jgi:hypothetical protein